MTCSWSSIFNARSRGKVSKEQLRSGQSSHGKQGSFSSPWGCYEGKNEHVEHGTVLTHQPRLPKFELALRLPRVQGLRIIQAPNNIKSAQYISKQTELTKRKPSFFEQYNKLMLLVPFVQEIFIEHLLHPRHFTGVLGRQQWRDRLGARPLATHALMRVRSWTRQGGVVEGAGAREKVCEKGLRFVSEGDTGEMFFTWDLNNGKEPAIEDRGRPGTRESESQGPAVETRWSVWKPETNTDWPEHNTKRGRRYDESGEGSGGHIM